MFEKLLYKQIKEYLLSNNLLSDLSKALDFINHDQLKNKLYDLVFSESAIEIIPSFISNRQQKTVVNNTEFNWISLYQGAPQGTIL